MDSPSNQAFTGAPTSQIPFTKDERFKQLAEIDEDIADLLTHASKAIQSLTLHPPTDDGTAMELDISAPLEDYKAAMNAFVVLLDSVDKRLKRQIHGLAEEVIITLPSGGAAAAEVREAGQGVEAAAGAASGANASGTAARASLDPNGMGMLGMFDLGRLNSNGVAVEREKESETWAHLRRHLEEMVAEGSATGADRGRFK